MLHSKQRLLELNAKLAENLTSKGVTATADETTTALVNKVAEISTGGGESSVLSSLIDGSLTEITIPKDVSEIRSHAFDNYLNLTKVTLQSPTRINTFAFQACPNLKTFDFQYVTRIDDYAFARVNGGLEVVDFTNCEYDIKNLAFMLDGCTGLKTLIFGKKQTKIGWAMANNCKNLSTLYITSSITTVYGNSFGGCTALEFVTIEDGFNANNLNLSVSTKYSHDTILSWLNALADRTGLTAYKLTIGATNLAKLTEEDILIATNKNWTLA